MTFLDEKVNEFVRVYLANKPNKTSKSKYVHDPLWGTIKLLDHELDILDTPLLQRLRQIHQTGFVYETYPSAKHTRFEHTIGVIHLSGKIAEILKTKYPEKVSNDAILKVRLAAIMHDVGHSAFSHTTEELYQYAKDIEPLLKKGGRFEDKGAGEVLSFLITTSDAFTAYYNELQNRHPDIANISIEDFAPLILGKSSIPEKHFEADIISGSFDADKLDYFPRDGRAVGIELSIDIERLLHCIEIAELDNKCTLSVNRGGYNAIQQLLFARATLFASVYHHHKVRACDCMAKSCFRYFIEEKKLIKVSEQFPNGFSLKSAADFLYITDLDFFGEACKHPSDSIEHKIIHNLLYRRLIKRALIISSSTIEDFSSDEITAGYSQFYNLRANPIMMYELALEIWGKANIQCSKWEVAIDIPKKPNFDKAGTALINRSTNMRTDIVKLSEVIPVEEWVSTYKQYYAQSYIFGPQDIDERKKIVIAAKTILKEKFGFKLNKYAYPSDLTEYFDSPKSSEEGMFKQKSDP